MWEGWGQWVPFIPCCYCSTPLQPQFVQSLTLPTVIVKPVGRRHNWWIKRVSSHTHTAVFSCLLFFLDERKRIRKKWRKDARDVGCNFHKNFHTTTFMFRNHLIVYAHSKSMTYFSILKDIKDIRDAKDIENEMPWALPWKSTRQSFGENFPNKHNIINIKKQHKFPSFFLKNKKSM